MILATRYAEAVVAGQVVAGELVALACERHLRDLRDGGRWHFDARRAQRVVRFFRLLRHVKGEWAGRPLELEPWQAFIVQSVFGWVTAEGRRRFRVALLEIARKNAKSTMGSGIGLYLLLADDEAGAEVYAAATAREQARIVFDGSVEMLRAAPGLARHARILAHSIVVPATRSKFRPLSSDSNKLDGLNVHGAIVDELHAHPNSDLWDVLETATPARRQPLLLGITTAGEERASFAGAQRDYAEAVLRRQADDPGLFAFVAELDAEDDWQDEACWAKANPNLGVSVSLEDLRAKATTAAARPDKQAAFRRLHLNQWILGGEATYLRPARWTEGAGPIPWHELPAHLAGRRCFGGLDLSATTDLSAFALVFPPEGDELGPTALVRHFLPEGRALDLDAARRDRVPYPAWVEAGVIETNPGDVIDQSFVRARILADAEAFDLEEIAFDPYRASQLVLELEAAGLILIPTRQGVLSMNEATQELQALTLERRLRHGANPCLDWQAGHLRVASDASGNVKPDRKRSRHRIDGMVALVLALDRWIRNRATTPPPPSVYAAGRILLV